LAFLYGLSLMCLDLMFTYGPWLSDLFYEFGFSFFRVLSTYLVRLAFLNQSPWNLIAGHPMPSVKAGEGIKIRFKKRENFQDGRWAETFEMRWNAKIFKNVGWQ
jgi:hypothetical protein